MRYLLIFCLVFIMALPNRSFGQVEQQKATNWCWVACVQSVLYQAGRYLPQEQIAATLTGWPQNRPANISELVALCQYFGLRAWEAGRPGNPQELYGSLRSGWKLIAFVRPTNGPVGHFIVLQGINTDGSILVSDPAYGVTNSYDLAQLYYGLRWADSVVVGRKL